MELREKQKSLNSLLEEVNAHPVLTHQWLSDIKSMSDSEFIIAFRQYIKFSSILGNHFASYVQKALASCNSNELHDVLQENLNEELGLVGSDATPHTILFKAMVEELDEAVRCTPQSRTSNSSEASISLQRILVGKNKFHLLGALLLGSEYVVPKLYKPILERLIICKTHRLSKAQYFFTVHIQCDQEHGTQAVNALLSEIQTPRDIVLLREGAMTALNCRLQSLDDVRAIVKELQPSNTYIDRAATSHLSYS